VRIESGFVIKKTPVFFGENWRFYRIFVTTYEFFIFKASEGPKFEI